jgi:hypothetical protein
MQGDFEIGGPASSSSAATTQSAPKPKPVQVSGNAVDFRAAVDAGVKAMRGAAEALKIPQVEKATGQFLELVERSARIMEA